MKISKTAVLTLGGVFATAGLGFMFVSAADKNLFMDLNNAVQHFVEVKFVESGNDDGVMIKRGGNSKPSIDINRTDAGSLNFILTKTGASELNKISNSKSSSILGGIHNTINGKDNNVILGGESNTIEGNGKSYYNVILGGNENKIQESSQSTILGGNGNTVNGGYFQTVIGNGNTASATSSLTIGKNNKVNSNANNSIALGSNATVSSPESFIWSDGTSSTLGAQAFAVLGDGMAVNTDKAHAFAKLTIGGSLRINELTNLACTSVHEGVVKMVANGTKKCFCSCDGTSWNSLNGGGACASKCNSSVKPKCGSDVSCGGTPFKYKGSCDRGKIVEGDDAYFIDKANKLHWACEEEDGSVAFCEEPAPTNCNVTVPGPDCDLPAKSCKLPVNGDANLLRQSAITQDDNNYYWTCYYGAKSKSCTLAKKSCINLPSGAVPNNSKKPDVETSYYYAPGSSDACTFYCPSPTVWNGVKCVTYSCQGTVPANATLVAGSDQNLTANTTRKLYASLAAAGSNKCAYVCDSTHEYKNGSCVTPTTFSCQGTVPANATLVAGSDQGLTANTTRKLYASLAAAGSNKCAYVCDSTHEYKNGSCVTPTTFSCQGTVPANATLVAGSDQNLTANTTRKLYSSLTAAGSNKCAYVCDSTHEYKNGSCVEKSYTCATTLANKYKCENNGTYVNGTNTSYANNEYMWFCNNGTTKCGICDDGTKAEPPHNGACLGGPCSDSTHAYHAEFIGTNGNNARIRVWTDYQLSVDVTYNISYGYNIGGWFDKTVSVKIPAGQDQAASDWFYVGGRNGSDLRINSNPDKEVTVGGCKHIFRFVPGLNYECQGTVPANATLVAGSDQGLTANTTRKLYASLAAAGSNKCAYVCDSTHEYKNGSCVEKSYTCATTLANKYKCENNGTYVNGTNTSHANNEYMWFCNNGTTKCGICDDGTIPSTLHNGACKKPAPFLPDLHIDSISACKMKYHFNGSDPISGKTCCNPVRLERSYDGVNWSMVMTTYGNNGTNVTSDGKQGMIYFRYSTDGGENYSSVASYNMTKQYCGSSTSTYKVDRNGNAFNWQTGKGYYVGVDGKIYNGNLNRYTQPNCQGVTESWDGTGLPMGNCFQSGSPFANLDLYIICNSKKSWCKIVLNQNGTLASSQVLGESERSR